MKEPRGLGSCGTETQLLETASSASDQQDKQFTFHESDLSFLFEKIISHRVREGVTEGRFMEVTTGDRAQSAGS